MIKNLKYHKTHVNLRIKQRYGFDGDFYDRIYSLINDKTQYKIKWDLILFKDNQKIIKVEILKKRYLYYL